MTGARWLAVGTVALLIAGAAHDAAGRGGGGRGGGGGGGRGGGFSRGGAAAGGSFGHSRPGGGQRGGFNQRGAAAGGTFAERAGGGFEGRYGDGGYEGARPERPGDGDRYDSRQERIERREGRREEKREDWQDYADDHYDDHVYGYYGDGYYPYGAVVTDVPVETVVAIPPDWTLDCTPAVVVVSGTTYYQCAAAWYVRVYSAGEVAYTMVNPPAGY